MNTKKITTAILSSLLLFGCASSPGETAENSSEIKPVPVASDLKKMMPKATYDIMSGIYGDNFVGAAGMLDVVGTDLGDYSLTTMKDETITSKDFKDKNGALEI
ncbi:MAG: hypothetical protein RSE60_03185 [Erysipelotrichaceae bacterium]